MRHLLRRIPQLSRQITPDNRIARDACRFRKLRQAAIVSENKTVRKLSDKKPSRLAMPEEETHEALAQGFLHDEFC